MAAAPATTADQAPVTRQQLPFKKAFITGFCVLGEMTTGGLFMENVKMEKQRTGLSYPRIASGILKQGVSGFEAGLYPWGALLGMVKGLVLGGSKVELFYWGRRAGLNKEKADIASGFGAGAVQGVFMSPILLARTRVNQSLTERAAAGKVDTSFVAEMRVSQQVLSSAIRQEGWGVLTTGMSTMVVKRALDWGSRFVFIGEIKKQVMAARPAGHVMTDWEKLSTSFVGGGLSVFVTIPIDRCMPVIQAASAGGGGALAAIRAKFAQEGVRTLFSGLLMRVCHTGYHTAWAVFVADKVYGHLSKKE